MAGKGDDRRPAQISEEELAWRWALAFGTTSRAKNGAGKEPREAKARRIGQAELFEWSSGLGVSK